MDSGIQKTQNSVTQALQEKIERGKSMRAFLDRVVYTEYQNAQRERWMTEGASEGFAWPALKSLTYIRQKSRKFAAFPGGGKKMMIATGRLYNSVTGDSAQEHRKVVTDNSIDIYTTVDYAQYTDEARTFTKFGDDFRTRIQQAIVNYMARNS